jgi:hypothetical protein
MSFEDAQAYFKARTVNLVLFLISCILAFVMKWNANDIAWSLWMSNLFLTSAIIVVTTVVASKKEASFVLIGVGLFIFSIAFHLGQTVPLNATLPFKGKAPYPNEIKESLASVFVSLWPWLPIAFYHCRDFLLHPPNFFSSKVKSINPVKSIIFFNVLIYVIILFHKILRLDGFVAALVTYILYFFFFDRDLTRKKTRS